MNKLKKLTLFGAAIFSIASSQLEDRLADLKYVSPMTNEYATTARMLSDDESKKVAEATESIFIHGRKFHNPMTVEHEKFMARFTFYTSNESRIFSSVGFSYSEKAMFNSHKEDVMLNYKPENCSFVMEKNKTIAFIEMYGDENPSKELLELVSYAKSNGYNLAIDLCTNKKKKFI